MARVVRGCDGLVLAGIADRDADRRALAMRLYPDVQVWADGANMIERGDFDAVIVATPPSQHYRYAEKAMRAGKHVMVTKPLASSELDAESLVAVAEQEGVELVVDHTFVFTGAVRKMRDLVASGGLGDVLFVDSVRVNLGLFQHDANVVWDLAPHDLSILAYVLDAQPSRVQAVGAAPVRGEHVELAYLTLWYGNGTIVHVHVNWLSPVKVRRMLIGGSRKMLVYDDLEPSEKVRVYDTGVEPRSPADVRATLVDYRVGDCWSPKLDFTEALAVEVDHFAAVLRGDEKPIVDGQAGAAVVRVLEATDESLRDDGKVVEL